MTNKLFKLNIVLLRIPNGWRQTSWLFASTAEDLNSGLPWSGWNLTWGPLDGESNVLTTQSHRILLHLL